MSKRHADSTQSPKRRKLSADEVLLTEAARNGDTTAVQAILEKLPRDSNAVAFDAAHEACRGNHDDCLALLLPYEKSQMGFGILLSECVHTDHGACTEVLLQHWKSVCSNGALVSLCGPRCWSRDGGAPTANVCPAMWADPAVCRVFIDAGADIETKTRKGRCSPLHLASRSGSLEVVKVLVRAGAGVCVTDHHENTCLILAAYFGRTETVRYLVGLPEVDVKNSDSRRGRGYETAMYCAVNKCRGAVEQVLVDAGADIPGVVW